jgi:hypothetical protein
MLGFRNYEIFSALLSACPCFHNNLLQCSG